MSKQLPPQEAQWPGEAIFTVGHSTLPIERFITLLHTCGIECLADIRTVPRSRHNPQFNDDALPAVEPLSDSSYRMHKPTPFARVEGTRISYPAEQATLLL